MGCDIHFVVEARRKHGGKWIGVYSTDLSPNLASDTATQKVIEHALTDPTQWSSATFDNQTPSMKHRNYSFFGALAGVRASGPDPKGVPDDASDLALSCADDWAGDGHSHSWDTLRDFLSKWVFATYSDKAMALRVTDEAAFEKTLDLLAGGWILSDAATEYRVVYWFDN